MTTHYGFSISNSAEQQAWFHTRAAAEQFNSACGGELGEVETTDTADQPNVMDTIENPWAL